MDEIIRYVVLVDRKKNWIFCSKYFPYGTCTHFFLKKSFVNKKTNCVGKKLSSEGFFALTKIHVLFILCAEKMLVFSLKFGRTWKHSDPVTTLLLATKIVFKIIKLEYDPLTDNVIILSNSIAGAMWKSNTKYWKSKWETGIGVSNGIIPRCFFGAMVNGNFRFGM